MNSFIGSLKATAREGGGGITLIFLLTREVLTFARDMARGAYYAAVEVDLAAVVMGIWRRVETCDMLSMASWRFFIALSARIATSSSSMAAWWELGLP